MRLASTLTRCQCRYRKVSRNFDSCQQGARCDIEFVFREKPTTAIGQCRLAPGRRIFSHAAQSRYESCDRKTLGDAVAHCAVTGDPTTLIFSTAPLLMGPAT